MERAVVQGVDRRHGRASCISLGETTAKSCVYLNDAPPPRSVVWIEQVASGQWAVMGVETPTERVFHEDFGLVLPAAVGSQILLYSDQTWVIHDWNNNGSTVTQSQLVSETGFARRVNSAELRTGSLAGSYISLAKGGAGPWLVADGALWMHAIVAVNNPTSTAVRVGWGDVVHAAGFHQGQAGMRFTGLEFDTTSGLRWLLHSIVDTAQTYTDTSVAVNADQFYDIDLVVVPGLWVAGWIDGAFVGAHSTNVPPYGAFLSALAEIYPRANQVRSLHVDLIDVTHLGGVVSELIIQSGPPVVEGGGGTGGGPSTYPFPDVVPTAIVPLVGGVPVDPLTGINVGDHVRFRVTWLNQGGVATPPNSIQAGTVIHDQVISVDGAQVTWGDLTHASIAAGATADIDTGPTFTNDPVASGLNVDWVATAGDHLIEAFINSIGRINEGGASGNNIASTTFRGNVGAGLAPVITVANPPDRVEDTVYPPYQMGASGTPPLVWSITSGAIPTGMAFSASGVLSGTPTTPGTYNFDVTVTNDFGSDTASITIVITVTSVGGGRADGMLWASTQDVADISNGVYADVTLAEVCDAIGGVAMLDGTDARRVGAYPSWVAAMVSNLLALSSGPCAFGLRVGSTANDSDGVVGPPHSTGDMNDSLTGLGHAIQVCTDSGATYLALDCEPYERTSGDGGWWQAEGGNPLLAHQWGLTLGGMAVSAGVGIIIYPSSDGNLRAGYNDLIQLQAGATPPGGFIDAYFYTGNIYNEWVQGMIDAGADVTHCDASFHAGPQYQPDGGDWNVSVQRTVALTAAAIPGLKGSIMGWPDVDEHTGTFYSFERTEAFARAASLYSTGPWVYYQQWERHFPTPYDISIAHNQLAGALEGRTT